MPRPRKCRKVCCLPKVSEFMPSGGAPDEACVVMTVDEYETIRLIDKENFSTGRVRKIYAYCQNNGAADL